MLVRCEDVALILPRAVDVGEPVGMRTIIVDAVSGEHGGHAELAFNVEH